MNRSSEPGDEPRHRLRTTGPGPLVAAVLVGLVFGWAIRPLSIQIDASAPRVSWLQVGALYLGALILFVAARATHRSVSDPHLRLSPHQAVNRLVLAKSCALAGAVVLGGYLGYALSWVGIEAELSSERIGHSLVAAGGSLLIVVAALLLERACRTKATDEES